jgi:hypothetical protein
MNPPEALCFFSVPLNRRLTKKSRAAFNQGKSAFFHRLGAPPHWRAPRFSALILGRFGFVLV